MPRKLHQINVRTAVRNLLTFYDAATPTQAAHGARWYSDARIQAEDMSALFGYPVAVCAAIIAHLSPQTRWEDNIEFAFHVAEFGTRPAGCMQGNFDRAWKAIVAHQKGDDVLSTFGPRAHKTRRFAAAIIDGGTGSNVVIDVWMLRAILQGKGYVFRDGAQEEHARIIKRVGVYEQCERAVQIAARRRDVPPAVFQAIVWTVISGAQ